MLYADGGNQGQRKCNGCTLCCRLVPVEELKKNAGERCKHQYSKGCRIYATRPMSCRAWSCMWLLDPVGTHDLRRPDHSHYVLDEMQDEIAMTYDDGRKVNHAVVQVWCDPKHPHAHRDPALRALLDRHGLIALVRYDSMHALVLFPPSRSEDHLWHETEVNECDPNKLSMGRRALYDMMRGIPNEAAADLMAQLGEFTTSLQTYTGIMGPLDKSG